MIFCEWCICFICHQSVIHFSEWTRSPAQIWSEQFAHLTSLLAATIKCSIATSTIIKHRTDDALNENAAAEYFVLMWWNQCDCDSVRAERCFRVFYSLYFSAARTSWWSESESRGPRTRRNRAGITEKRGKRARGWRREAYSREHGVASRSVAFSPELLKPDKPRQVTSQTPTIHSATESESQESCVSRGRCARAAGGTRLQSYVTMTSAGKKRLWVSEHFG